MNLTLLRRALRRHRPDQDVAPGAAGDTAETGAAETGATTTRAGSSRRAVRVGALAAVAVVLVTGSVAVARAHKTVTLDVDGVTRDVGTFAGSVAGLLAEEGVEVSTRDVVAPAPDTGLRSGDEVVVRSAHSLSVQVDGETTSVWTTALTLDEALATLALRGDDVRVVASRSVGGPRADLPLELAADGPVEVVVEGRTERVADGSRGLAELLADLGIELGEHDRVTVVPAPGPGDLLRVVVQRVVVQEQTVTSEVPFETVTEATGDLYRGQSRTVTAGVPGELTSLHRVVLVDGVEESRRVLSEQVTRDPVTAVVAQGTRARPAASGGTVSLDGVWDRLAKCESGGNPRAVSASGTYHGLFQFSVSTWRSVGGSGLPSEASPAEQLQRAQALQARSGWGQWPACAKKLGLL